MTQLITEFSSLVIGAIFAGIGTGSPAIGFAVLFIGYALWQPGRRP